MIINSFILFEILYIQSMFIYLHHEYNIIEGLFEHG